MAREPTPEIDDELFKEVYGKEYTGPLGSRNDDSSSKGNNNSTSNKRPASSFDDGDGDFVDPNAVPTDFTSREAKVWEAKAKAIERNWKKRKEEEMICKLCGESGHFTQGCPSTLGGNRKSADFFERVPARDKHVRALFTERVISQIEKEIGCKIRMDEKFLFVSGKDRLILSKGVDAVHKIIQEGKSKTESPPTYHRTRSKSPRRSPIGSDYKRPEPQRSHSNPRSTPRFPSRNISQERGVEDRARQDQRSFSRESPPAFSNVGARGRSAHSRSPPRSNIVDHAYGTYNHNYSTGSRKADDWNVARHGADFHSERKVDMPGFSQTLEDLELDFKREALELARSRDQEEDDENYKHREGIREIRDDYMQKLTSLRAMHSKQWEEFLQLDVQRRQQASCNAYTQQVHSNYDHSSRYTQYMGSNLPAPAPTVARSRYPYPGENYSSSTSPHDPYGDFQNPRSDGFGRQYGRY